ncbi:NfeD family protein [Eubacterium xylanophilum]|uniref:NfeD family protein n=1 Tax=Eubacterium xylanophilum TaxID=39497 RepID=UPI00047B1A2B|nr:NfeD family protein [Eubacterium xylanophilum]
MMTVWIAILLIAIIAEISTTALVSIWFIFGAIAALIAYFLGFGIPVQIGVCAVFSLLSVVFLRPITKKYLSDNKTRTNADELIGASVVISERVDAIAGTGLVKVRDVEWRVRTEDGSTMEVGEQGVVKEIKGVTLVVEKKQ